MTRRVLKHRERTPPGPMRLQLQFSRAMYDALQRMDSDDMRSPANLVRKILADHLCNHKYLSRDQVQSGNFDGDDA